MAARVALITWHWQGYRFALDARQVAQLHCGTAGPDTLLMPHLLQQAGSTSEPAINWLLECRGADGLCQLGLADEPHHQEVDAHQLRPLPAALLPARNSSCIRALVWYPAQPPALLLDARLFTTAIIRSPAT